MPRASYGPEDRRLLETAAVRIFSEAVDLGALAADDPRLAGEELKPAVAVR